MRTNPPAEAGLAGAHEEAGDADRRHPLLWGKSAGALVGLSPVRVGFALRAFALAVLVLARVARGFFAGHWLGPPSLWVTPSSSSDTWTSSLSPGPPGRGLDSSRTASVTVALSAFPGVRRAGAASGLSFVLEDMATEVATPLGVRLGSPEPATWERSCTAALRPSIVLAYFMPIVVSGSSSSRRFT